jgi:dipeptidyl aminopeptidase/acylaminoacyl peptidase
MAIVNADGTGFHTLPIPAGLNLGCGVWAPDGTHCAGEGWNDQGAGVYLVNIADGSAVRLTSNPLGGHDIPGDFSPDGTQLVFGRYDSGDTGIGLFIVNTDGSGLHELTSAILQPANDGDWSPQGNRIVFSRHVTADEPGSLWIVNSDGTGLHQLNVKGLACGAVGCHEPRWSPDGKKIIFATSGQDEIYTINADGTGLKPVATGDDPVWGTHPNVACTPTEKIQRAKALAAFRHAMKARRRAFFAAHRSPRARIAYIKTQKATLKKLQTLAAACG